MPILRRFGELPVLFFGEIQNFRKFASVKSVFVRRTRTEHTKKTGLTNRTECDKMNSNNKESEVNPMSKDTQSTQPEWLTVKQFADAVQVSVGSVRNWISNGSLKAYKVGTRYRIPASELERMQKSWTDEA